jgi:pimeloyl-ACP methyl ester carboxylesterase
MPAPRDRTPVLLLHGFWHGSWCWTEVLAALTGAGVRALPVDMAGHGLRARRPAALTRRPFDAGALAAEVSPVAGVDLDQAGDLLVAQGKQLGAGAPVTVVAHSMGGAVLTRAGQLAPELIAHAVYLAAFMPASGVPSAAYPRMPEN